MPRLALVLIVTMLLAASTPPAAEAGGHGAHVAVGFATVLFAPLIIAGAVVAAVVPPYRPAVVVAPAPVYQVESVRYAAAPAYSTPRPAAYAPAESRNVVRYPHGRYVLRGDGIATAYQWVWIPNPPPPPPPPPRLASQ